MRKKPKNIPKRVLDVVVGRSDGFCEVMSVAIGCTGRGEHKHHRKISGREHTAENLLDVCHMCHAYIHANPALSYAMGWLVKMNYEPLLESVIRQGQEVFLSADGGVVVVGAND